MRQILKVPRRIISTLIGNKARIMVKTMSSKHFTFVALAAATLAVSCASDDIAEHKQDQNTEEEMTVELTANLDDGKTTAKRVGMKNATDSYASFYWQNGDGILVQVNGSDGNYTGKKFTTSVATGKTVATFKGKVAKGSYMGSYAVYPSMVHPEANYTHEFTSATGLTFKLPSKYPYSVVESNIFPITTNGVTTYPTNTTRVPMVGRIREAISFNHIAGLVVIRIDEMPAAEGTLKFAANEQVCGDFSCDLSADEPVITTAKSTTNNDVTLNFSGATNGETGVFYLPLPTGSYSGVTIEINYVKNDSETFQRVNYGNLYVPRASVTAIPLYTIDGKLEKFSSISGNEYTFNGQKFVDLGLSSGLLWAEKNVGADSETDYGNSYAWGEIATKSGNAWDTYKYGDSATDITKYNSTDNKSILEAEDDAATRNWGNGCRMPTYEEFKDFTTNGNPSWAYNNNVYGFKFTGNNTGSSVFLPGYYTNSQTSGTYWSGSIGTLSGCAYVCLFSNDGLKIAGNYSRCSRYLVRAVTER